MNSGSLARFILIALVSLLLFASPAQAATYNVSNQSQWNSAVTAAFSTSEDDVINITASFTLAADSEAIFSNVTINGNGHTINGADQHSAISIATAGADVTINNLTLAENKGATGSNGGAILYTIGSSLTLNNVTIRDSASASASANGGGLYCGAANLTIRNSLIHNNSGSDGGGIYLDSGCTGARIINSSVYDNNSTRGGTGAGGGGIHVAGGASVTISGSRIYGNTAGTAVGTNTAARGGGLYAYGSSSSAATVTINSSSIYNNLAYDAGGGLWSGGRNTLNVSGSAFYGNDSKAGGGAGGGIALRNEPGSASTQTITNTSIFNNTASGRGGGIFASLNFQGTTSVVTLRHVTISGNSTSLTGTHQGGGLYASTAKVTLQNSIVFNNRADGNASNCIFSGLPTASQSATLTPVLAHNIVGAGSASSSNQAHCTPNSDSSDPQLESSTSGNPPYLNLRLGSPAIDSADCLSSVTTDQRGRPRPNPASTDGKCDKGAIEWYAPPPPPQRSISEDAPDAGARGSSSSKSASSASIKAAPVSTCLTLEGIAAFNLSESTQCQRVNAMQIANPTIKEGDFVDAVDVWSWVTPDTQICFEAKGGAFKFINTAVIPRTIQDWPAFARDGMTCASIDGPGILILLPGDPPEQAAPAAASAPVSSRSLQNCMVTLTEKLNFRETPGGEIMVVLSKDMKLTAEARTDSWFQVDFWGQKGWISADYVETEGTCA